MSDDARPEHCAVCSTAIPPSVDRCIACGAVWGEDNRCPHCHGLAAIRPTDDGYACLACGKPREKKPKTTVVGSGGGFGGTVPGGDRVVAARGASIGLRLFGIVSVAGGIAAAAAIVALAGTGFGALLAATAIGGLGVGIGALSMRAGSRASSHADDVGASAREQAILKLAEKKGFELTVTDLVQELGYSAAQADAALSRMADGSRVSAEVTTDGRVKYVFRELQSLQVTGGSAAVRARVDVGAPQQEAVYEEAMEEVENLLRERPE